MKAKKQPERMCVACREHKNKHELIRVVRTAKGGAEIDEGGKANGRGAYLCLSIACIELAQKKRSLGRALKIETEKELFDKLRKIAEKNG